MFGIQVVVILQLFTIYIESRNVKPQNELYLPDYNIYHNLTSIQDGVENLARRFPSFIKLDHSHRSRLGKSQLLLHVTNFSDLLSTESHHSKSLILLSYGEHAREFFPIESMFNLLDNLTGGVTLPQHNPKFKFSHTVLSKIDLYIVAIMNPDGRKYVESSGNYCWRGTSTGVDLNRNFDWQFGGKGSSAHRQDEEYRGSYAFSEPETKVLQELTEQHSFDAFVSLHSGIKQIYVPYADTISKKNRRQPTNIIHMLELAELMAVSVANSFTFGLAYQLNEYTADGTIFDYMAGRRQIPFSFAIELWGEGGYNGAKCFDLFNPQSQQLKIALAKVHPIYVTLFKYIIQLQPVEESVGVDRVYVIFALLIVVCLLAHFCRCWSAKLRPYQHCNIFRLI